MKYRHRVLLLLSLLSALAYLDRVCISVAGPRIQEELRLGPSEWGWVVGVFAIAYGAFEIPSGYLGDRFGPRRILTRIVLWWSAFTVLTGMVTSFGALLVTRCLFGAGEAGAYPNSSAAISRWFPATERGRAFGIVWMASQAGAALSPLLVVPIQMRYGWRASFYVFGLLGVVWSAMWLWWYRDDPAAKRGITRAELLEIDAAPHARRRAFPVRTALRDGNLRLILLMALAYCYGMYFFIAWFHTWLERSRGFGEAALTLSAVPFVLGGIANACGGFACDRLVRAYGLRSGRRIAGAAGLTVAALCIAALLLTTDRYATLLLLALSYAGITFQQPVAWAVCLDVGGEYAGAVSGAMNSAAQVGSFLLSVSFGYITAATGNYDLPLLPIAVALAAGALCWLRIDATRTVVPTAAIRAA